MILEIVTYGHPALRAKGRRVEKIDASTRQLARDMIETMADADGVGLAAQQVGLPLQLCVVDVSAVKDRPSVLRLDGTPVPLDDHMPLVLINPEVEPFGKSRAGQEGCLSLPGVRAEIIRPYSVRVKSQTLEGKTVAFEADGLLARAIQHENDHLQGVLILDRMEPKQRKAAEAEIEGDRQISA